MVLCLKGYPFKNVCGPSSHSLDCFSTAQGAFGGAGASAGDLTPAEKQLLSGLSAGCSGGGRLQNGCGDAHNSPGVTAELRELWEMARSVLVPQSAATPMVH